MDYELIAKLIRIIQRLEREGAQLTSEDVKVVYYAKSYLGFSTPETTEQGTGTLI